MMIASEIFDVLIQRQYMKNIIYHHILLISFDNLFIETSIYEGIIFKAKRSGIFHNASMNVNPGYKFIEKFRGGVQWYRMRTNDFISIITFKLLNENGDLVSFNGQSITFR